MEYIFIVSPALTLGLIVDYHRECFAPMFVMALVHPLGLGRLTSVASVNIYLSAHTLF